MSLLRTLIRIVAAVQLAMLAASGCATLSDAAATNPLTGRSTASRDDDEERRGLSWSDFSPDNIGKTLKRATGRGPNRELAKQLYAAADAEYRQAAASEGPERIRLFESAADKFYQAADRWPDSALALDGYFMAGEAMFFADHYAAANKYYEELIKAFPNNRYIDIVDQRRYAIAQYWLEIDRQNPEELYYVNFFDKTRPWKDARGHGLRVFDKIRIDDPTGRLADDATLSLGNENFVRRKFLKADEYYSDLRKAYPSSEHQFSAHFLGLKAKLNAYDGPAYSGAPLDEAEKLVKQMRRAFPQECEKEREYIERAAAEIRFKKAERLAFLAQYYDRRAEYRAARHHYERIATEYPDTPLAAKAQERAGQIAGLPPVPPQRAQWLVNLLPETDKVKPLLEATEQERLAEAQRASNERNASMEQDRDAGREPSLGGELISNFLDR
jgi:outer membrane protein assembly factor BamD (BamD/ComL family)